MTEIDLWADEEDVQSEVEIPKVEPGEVAVSIGDHDLTLVSKHNLKQRRAFSLLPGLQADEFSDSYKFRISKTAGSMFVLRYALSGLKVVAPDNVLQEMKTLADKNPNPAAALSEDKKYIHIRIPRAPVYTNMMKLMAAKPLDTNDYRITVAKAQDLNGHNNALPKYTPKIALADNVKELLYAPIPGFDGSIESLKNVPIDALTVVGSNAQTWKNLSKSKKTLAEKMQSMGLNSLYDLMFFMPRRYIDKSTPQSIRSLIAGESATLLGTIVSVGSVGGIGGTKFKIEANGGGQIDVVFFRQEWLDRKSVV